MTMDELLAPAGGRPEHRKEAQPQGPPPPRADRAPAGNSTDCPTPHHRYLPRRRRRQGGKTVKGAGEIKPSLLLPAYIWILLLARQTDTSGSIGAAAARGFQHFVSSFLDGGCIDLVICRRVSNLACNTINAITE